MHSVCLAIGVNEHACMLFPLIRLIIILSMCFDLCFGVKPLILNGTSILQLHLF